MPSDAIWRDELGGGVEVGEGGERRRVGVVVGGHVHGLQRRDRTTPGRGDALLQLAHLVGQRRLVAHGRRHAAEQGRHLGAGLHEAEDVVDEQQHVLVLHVAEVLGHRQRRERHPQAHARRLVHLAEHERGLLDDARLLHLDQQVGALTGALADAGEHRHTTVLRGDPVDHLLDEHGLAHAGAAEQADLAAGQVGREQVDDLDAGLEHLRLGLERVERRRLAVDVPALVDAVEHLAGRPSSGSPITFHTWPSVTSPTGTLMPWPVLRTGAPRGQAVGRLQRDDPHPAVADLLGDLAGDHGLDAFELDGHLDGGVDLGQRAAGELDVDHRAGDGDDPAVLERGGGRLSVRGCR